MRVASVDTNVLFDFERVRALSDAGLKAAIEWVRAGHLPWPVCSFSSTERTPDEWIRTLTEHRNVLRFKENLRMLERQADLTPLVLGFVYWEYRRRKETKQIPEFLRRAEAVDRNQSTRLTSRLFRSTRLSLADATVLGGTSCVSADVLVSADQAFVDQLSASNAALRRCRTRPILFLNQRRFDWTPRPKIELTGGPASRPRSDSERPATVNPIRQLGELIYGARSFLGTRFRTFDDGKGFKLLMYRHHLFDQPDEHRDLAVGDHVVLLGNDPRGSIEVKEICFGSSPQRKFQVFDSDTARRTVIEWYQDLKNLKHRLGLTPKKSNRYGTLVREIARRESWCKVTRKNGSSVTLNGGFIKISLRVEAEGFLPDSEQDKDHRDVLFLNCKSMNARQSPPSL